MTNIQTALRAVAVTVAALVLLTIGASLDGRVEAQSQGNALTGTWVWRAGSAVGFYTYHQDGTITGNSSLVFGTEFTPGPEDNLHSTDQGVWRQIGGGFEAVVFRMAFDPSSGDIIRITRIHTFFELDSPDKNSTTGTFGVLRWTCPTGDTCPDPNVDDPDAPEFFPPLEWTQTRVRIY